MELGQLFRLPPKRTYLWLVNQRKTLLYLPAQLHENIAVIPLANPSSFCSTIPPITAPPRDVVALTTFSNNEKKHDPKIPKGLMDRVK